MIDRENVIKGLKCIIEGIVRCESCGYAVDKHGHYSCQQNCASDAIALLKEQEAQRDYEASIEMAEYCERYEQTYNPEDGSM